MQRLNCFLNCMACDTVLVKPHDVHIHTLQFGHKRRDYPFAIASTTNCCRLTSRIFEGEWSDDDASSPKSVPKSDMLWMQLFPNNHLWILRNPNTIKMAMSSLTVEDDFARRNQHPFNEMCSLCVVSGLHFSSIS